MTNIIIPDLKDGQGTSISGSIEFRLVDSDYKECIGWDVVTKDAIRVATIILPDDTGTLLSLIAQAKIATEVLDEKTYYKVIFLVSGVSRIYYIQVPDDGGDHHLSDLIGISAIDPGSILSDLLLKQNEREGFNASPNPPGPGNPIATLADVTGGGLPSAEADEDIEVGQPIRIKSNGHVALANATQVGQSEVAGIAASSASLGFSLTYSRLRVTLVNWTSVIGTTFLTPGAIYFLDPSSPGKMTTIANEMEGEYLTRIGRAVTTETFQVGLEPTIRL